MRKIWKKLVAAVCAAVLSTGGMTGVFAFGSEPVQTGTWPAAPEVSSASAILMEATTGAVLYEKDADAIHYPASITKIMTALLAIENSGQDEEVVFSKEAIDNTEGSGIARDYGEQMTMEQCLYGMMLESANECAYAVAEHVGGGDYQKFITMMNEKAAALGCTNTHFTNSNGLPDEQHVTTCRDMALISSAAIQNSLFREIVGTVKYEIPPTNKHAEPTPLNNHHQMISRNVTSKNLYEYCIGGKTGYTNAAGNTLVTFAEKDGMTLVCVVMQASAGVHYTDTRNLFEYGFSHFSVYNVAQNETRFSTAGSGLTPLFDVGQPFARIDQSAQVILPVDAVFLGTQTELTYDYVTDNVVGTLLYSYEGHPVGRADVVVTGESAQTEETVSPEEENASGDEMQDAVTTIMGEIENVGRETGKLPAPVRILLMAGIIAAAAFAALLLVDPIRRVIRRKQRKDRRYKTIRPNRKWDNRRKRRRRR